ncbi:hypothetical protein C8R46DRAFT_1270591 [Mycena filopes]|nr:hypothetical protein C8R46DRAFT_1270591 [Mycena filopes]
MSARFPVEIWLRIFSSVDAHSLQSVVLACAHFHNAKSNLEFWDRVAGFQHIPRELSIENSHIRTGYERYYEESEPHPRIMSSVLRFPNLTSLSLSRTRLGPAFYQVLAGLPNMTHLSLSFCQLTPAPSHFPHSFPSFFAEDSQPVAVTDLSIHEVDSSYGAQDIWGTRADSPEMRLFLFLPHLRALTLKSYARVPRAVLRGLTSFSLAPETTDPIDLLNEYLPHIPDLLHLRIPVGPINKWDPHGNGSATAPTLTGTLPRLQSFVGPWVLAASLIADSPALTSLTINDFIPDTAAALTILEGASPSAGTLRHLDLSLVEWDDEVMYAIVGKLRACREVRVVYRFSQPDTEFIDRLGVDHLEHLPDLELLHLHAVPPPPPPRSPPRSCPRHFPESDSESDEEDKPKALVPAVLPAEKECAESLAAWTKDNPRLTAVRFVEGREWVKRDIGGRKRW